MKKALFLLMAVMVSAMFFTTGCTKKTEPVDSIATDTLDIDTIDTVKVDSVVEAAPMPKSADKLFADFFFDFISKKKVQMNRIEFPLKVVNGTNTRYVQRGQWRMERFYQNQEYYTQIFDNERQMRDVAKTKADTVIVEKIHLRQGTVEQYVFHHPDGKWWLTEIRTIAVKESKNASFLAFLQRFFSDGSYQMSHVKSPLDYYGPDPNGEDENKYIRTKISADSWADYLPEIPSDQIYNILRGQVYKEGNEKIFLFKGIANGLETQLRFQKQGGQWKLTKLSL